MDRTITTLHHTFVILKFIYLENKIQPVVVQFHVMFYQAGVSRTFRKVDSPLHHMIFNLF